MIKDLSQRLKELRIARGFSQKEVASQLGVSPSIISGYETGERTPSIENLLALSYLYKCSTDYLLGKPAVNISTLDVTGLSPENIMLVQSLVKALKRSQK